MISQSPLQQTSRNVINRHLMLKGNFIYGLLIIIGINAITSCSPKNNLTGPAETTNSKASIKKPYVLLISLDGFRWDYVERFHPPHLSNFIKNGVQAESLIPSFPSKTFPNHYTIATGMYPDHHGILGNSFYSHKKDLLYTTGNREMVEDGTFYGGTPIWVQADKSGMVSASYFFVGSEASIQGIRPTYHYIYDGSTKNDVRVAQALKWLALPAKNRPHQITLYFSDMDEAGHRYGPDNDEEIKKALFALDNQLGDLFQGTEATKLPINTIIVSDHGMTAIPTTNYIPIESIENDDLYLTINNGSLVSIHPNNDIKTDSVFQYLRQKENQFIVYTTANTPGFEYIPENRDWGPIQVIPDFGYYFSTLQRIATSKKYSGTTVGVHGYDPDYKDMHGIFYANGPAFKKGYIVSAVKNIHIYPLMCKILELPVPDTIDGNLKELESVLNNCLDSDSH